MPPSVFREMPEPEPSLLALVGRPGKKTRSPRSALGGDLVVDTVCTDLDDSERRKKRSKSKKSRHGSVSPREPPREPEDDLLDGELRAAGFASWAELEYRLQCVQRKYEQLKVLRKLSGDRGQETVALLNRLSDLQCRRQCRTSPKHSPTSAGKAEPLPHPLDEDLPKGPSDSLTRLALELAEGVDGDKGRLKREARPGAAPKRALALRPAGADALEQLQAELRSGEGLSDVAIATAVQRVVEALTVTRAGAGAFLTPVPGRTPAA
eukprot:EG_transcript_6247